MRDWLDIGEKLISAVLGIFTIWTLFQKAIVRKTVKTKSSIAKKNVRLRRAPLWLAFLMFGFAVGLALRPLSGSEYLVTRTMVYQIAGGLFLALFWFNELTAERGQ